MKATSWPLLLSLLGILQGCSDPAPVFHPADNPLRLSEWNLFSLANNVLTPSDEALVFQPANTLFTDYASKLRTLWIPPGTTIGMEHGEFDYPVGTILSKTFYYGEDDQIAELDEIPLDQYRLIETRLLVRRESGWEAFPYVWNEEESEAFLRVAGTSTTVEISHGSEARRFTYFVPNENQCGGCHVTEYPDGDPHPLGAIATQLQSAYRGQLQTEAMAARGWLDTLPDAPATLSWDGDGPLAQRATAYLNMHCGHCHNPNGAADTSSLILNGAHRNATEMGVCKPPVAAGGGTGDLQYAIVPGAPERSILLYRMQSQAPDEMMPELGRSLVHAEGVTLVSDWIQSMSGSCP